VVRRETRFQLVDVSIIAGWPADGPLLPGLEEGHSQGAGDGRRPPGAVVCTVLARFCAQSRRRGISKQGFSAPDQERGRPQPGPAGGNTTEPIPRQEFCCLATTSTARSDQPPVGPVEEFVFGKGPPKKPSRAPPARPGTPVGTQAWPADAGGLEEGGIGGMAWG